MTVRTVVETGVDNAGAALRAACADDRRTVVVLDGRVPQAARVASAIRHPVGGPIDLACAGADRAALADRLRAARPSRIVAIGGGTTIDAVKLAALSCSDPALLAYAARSMQLRSLTMLPSRGAASPVRVIAVPTTAGTSSEVTSVAVTTTSVGHRLVVGEQLRPARAVLDGQLLMTLSISAMREAAFEALLRVAGAATAACRPLAGAIECAVAIVRAGSTSLTTPRARLRVAMLSASTHQTAVGDAFAMKHWYVANEASFTIGARKIPTTAAVVPAVWRRIQARDRRWGHDEGLRMLWGAVARAAGLPAAPADGIHALARRWGIAAPARPSDDEIERIALLTEAGWGRTLPALRGLRAADIALVLTDGAWEARARSEPAVEDGLAHSGRR